MTVDSKGDTLALQVTRTRVTKSTTTVVFTIGSVERALEAYARQLVSDLTTTPLATLASVEVLENGRAVLQFTKEVREP